MAVPLCANWVLGNQNGVFVYSPNTEIESPRQISGDIAVRARVSLRESPGNRYVKPSISIPLAFTSKKFEFYIMAAAQTDLVLAGQRRFENHRCNPGWTRTLGSTIYNSYKRCIIIYVGGILTNDYTNDRVLIHELTHFSGVFGHNTQPQSPDGFLVMGPGEEYLFRTTFSEEQKEFLEGNVNWTTEAERALPPPVCQGVSEFVWEDEGNCVGNSVQVTPEMIQSMWNTNERFYRLAVGQLGGMLP